MDPITFILGATAVLSMASDAEEARRKRRVVQHALGQSKRVLTIPSPAYAANLVHKELRRRISDTTVHDLWLSVRGAFDGDGYQISWDGLVLYDREGRIIYDENGGQRADRELLSHSFTIELRNGKMIVALGSGHYDTNAEEFKERIRKRDFKAPTPSSTATMMPSGPVVAALVLQQLRLRDPSVKVFYVDAAVRPRFDGERFDLAWEGAVIYTVPDEGDDYLFREFTLRVDPDKWHINLLSPERSIENTEGSLKDLWKPYFELLERRYPSSNSLKLPKIKET